jgi:hypothetical protein
MLVAKVMSRFSGHREAGMATAEYAVGTVAAISFGGIIYRIIRHPQFQETIFNTISWLIGLIPGVVG